MQVDQPADCERVLETVPEPALREGSDFRIDYFRMRGSFRLANNIIDSGRECIANQRNAYGGKGNR